MGTGSPNRPPDDRLNSAEKEPKGPRLVNPSGGNRDARFDPHVSPNNLWKRKSSFTLNLLLLAGFVLLAVLLGLLMYKNFRKPSPRTPENPTGTLQAPPLQAPPLQPVSAAKVLPLSGRKMLQQRNAAAQR